MRQIINLGATAGDKTGTPARSGGRIINENFAELYDLIAVLGRIDIIEIATGIALVGQDLTVNANWEWYIDNQRYTNPAAVNITGIPYCATGKSRFVFVVPNDSNGFTLIDGEETTGSPIAPPLPNTGIYATFFTVTDSAIATPEDPNLGGNLSNKTDKGGYTGTSHDLDVRLLAMEFPIQTGVFVEKAASFSEQIATSGVIAALDLTLDESKGMSFNNAATELHSLYYSTKPIGNYNGCDFHIRNNQAIDLLIKHHSGISGVGNFKFSFPSGADFILKPNELIAFKMRFTDYNDGFLDYVGTIAEDLVIPVASATVSGTVKTTTTEVDPVVYTKTAADALLAGKLNTADYNDRFKGVFLTEAALNAAHPTASAGDYAQVNVTGSTKVVNYSWDAEDNVWAQGGSGGSAATNTDVLPEGTSNFYFTTARVLATLLTGISFATGGAIVSADSVLGAFGKLQKQISDAIDSISLKQDTLASGTNIKTINGSSILGSGDMTISSGGGDMTTTTDQTVSGIKTFLNGKFGLRNVANSFTSFFTNANTASRTYTLPDKNGTVAMLSDTISPSVVNEFTALQKFKAGAYLIDEQGTTSDATAIGNGEQKRLRVRSSPSNVDNSNPRMYDIIAGARMAITGWQSGMNFMSEGGSEVLMLKLETNSARVVNGTIYGNFTVNGNLTLGGALAQAFVSLSRNSNAILNAGSYNGLIYSINGISSSPYKVVEYRASTNSGSGWHTKQIFYVKSNNDPSGPERIAIEMISQDNGIPLINLPGIVKPNSLNLSVLGSYTDDAAASAGGVPVGYGYINSSTGAVHRRLV